MPSPQVQQWLSEGTSLREDLLAQMEKLETQRQELDKLLGERRFELDLLARILDRADDAKSGQLKDEGSDDPFNPKFNAKAGGAAKEQPKKDTWHAGMS